MSERSRFTKRFLLADGRRLARISSQPIHYRTDDGSWDEIGLEFETSLNGEGLGLSDAIAGVSGSGYKIRYGLIDALDAKDPNTAGKYIYLDDIAFADAQKGLSPRPGDLRFDLAAVDPNDPNAITAVGNGWTTYGGGCGSIASCTMETSFSDGNTTGTGLKDLMRHPQPATVRARWVSR